MSRAKDNEKDFRDDTGLFKIKNQYAKGAMESGSPPKYESSEVLAQKIAEYLEFEEKTSKGKFTISGLSLYLGFADKKSFYDYKNNDKRPELQYVIKRFCLFMEHYHEQKLMHVTTFPGAALWLKNWAEEKWVDKVEQKVDTNSTITMVKPNVIMGNSPPLAESEDQVKE